ADQDDVGDQPREPHRFRQVRLRLGGVDAAVPDHRGADDRLHLDRPGAVRGRPRMTTQVVAGVQPVRVSSFDLWKLIKRVAFFLLVVFPFYYAILTSFKSGTDIYRVNYWPTSFALDNYTQVFANQGFLQNLGNSVIVA